MPDGISRASGAGPMMTFAGKEYRIQGRSNGYYALLDAQIIARRDNPFQMFVDAARELIENTGIADVKVLGALSSMISRDFRGWRNVTFLEHLEFEETSYGTAFTIWYGLGAEECGLTIEEVRHEIEEERLRQKLASWSVWLEGFRKAIDQASGIDELGNSTGPDNDPGKTQTSASTGD